MGIMQFNIPDDVKAAFEAAFKDANADAVVAELLRKAAQERQPKHGDGGLVERMRAIRAKSTRTFTADEIRKAREELRE